MAARVTQRQRAAAQGARASNGVEHDKKDEKKIIGMGWDPGDKSSGAKSSEIISMLKQAMECSDPNYLPTIAKQEWQINRPMLPQDVTSTLGDDIDMLSAGDNVPGVQQVYSTPGLINGEFQTYNLAIAVGAHFRISTLAYECLGNAFLRPETESVEGISSVDWTRNDLLNGALGITWDGTSQNQPLFPARMQYNSWAARGLAAFIKGANYRWTYGSLVNIFDMQLADIAFMQFMTEDGASGISQVDVDDDVQRMNASYQEAGSDFDFRPYQWLRTGSVGNNLQGGTPNRGVFAGFNGDVVDAAYGAGGLRALFGDCCNNSPFAMLRKAYLLHPGVPPGLQFQASNADQMALFRRYFDITDGQNDPTVPPTLTDAAKVSAGFAPDLDAFPNAGLERTLDTPPVSVAQQRYNGRMLYRYSDGIFMATVVKGFEIWRSVAKAIENDEEVAREVMRTCGCALGWTQ